MTYCEECGEECELCEICPTCGQPLELEGDDYHEEAEPGFLGDLLECEGD